MAEQDLVELYRLGLIKVFQARFDDARDLEEDHLCTLDEYYAQSTPEQRAGFKAVSQELRTQYLDPGGMPHTRPPN